MLNCKLHPNSKHWLDVACLLIHNTAELLGQDAAVAVNPHGHTHQNTKKMMIFIK